MAYQALQHASSEHHASKRQTSRPPATVRLAIRITAVVPLTAIVSRESHRHPHGHGHRHRPKWTPGHATAAAAAADPPPLVVTIAVARRRAPPPRLPRGLAGAPPVATLVPRAERAPAQLGDAVTTPAAVAGARVRCAVARHQEALASPSAAAEQQAGAEGTRCQVQAGYGVLTQLLARRHRALVRLAVLQRREAALVAAAAQLAGVVLAVGLAPFEAVAAAVPAEVGSRALRLVVWISMALMCGSDHWEEGYGGLTILTRRVLDVALRPLLDEDVLLAPLLPTIPMIIAPVLAHSGRLGTVLHPADVQRAVLAPGGPLVPPLEAPLRLALVVHAVPPGPHVQPPVPAHGLHADVIPAVLPAARAALALARRLLAVVQAAPPHRRARVSRVAARRAALPGAAPVALAAAARVAPLAPPGDLGSARLRLARVRLAEEGPIVDQPWLVARVVRRREAAVLRAVALAAFVLAVFAVRVFAAV